MSLNQTPRANRLHIGIFGKTNSGKSSLVNCLIGHEVALVSEMAGTTTDPVYKSMELHPIGPVVFIDTAGFADNTILGKQREKLTEDIIKKTDVAIVIFDDSDLREEAKWIKMLEDAKVSIIPVVSKADFLDRASLVLKIKQKLEIDPVIISAHEGSKTREIVIDKIAAAIPEDYQRQTILRNLVPEDSLVVLVMPQDIQAPKGRLILPQVQTIREVLDTRCIAVCTTVDGLERTLNALNESLKLIITDSQCFKEVRDMKPKESKLTSFSVLFAAYKGDIRSFINGVNAIDKLDESSRILIAEACTHAPLEEDIGRVKIPAMLKKRFGANLRIDIVSGNDFPDDLSCYDLVIHCGGCMFNRKYMMNRVLDAKEQHVPMTNYGITIAYLKGILDEVVY